MYKDEYRYAYLYDAIESAKGLISDALGNLKPLCDERLIRNLIVISDNLSQVTNYLDFEEDKLLECEAEDEVESEETCCPYCCEF
jgi:hypothetical protein